MTDNNLVIRKLRKKLRQIENLSRCERELSAEEQLKVIFIFLPASGYDSVVL